MCGLVGFIDYKNASSLNQLKAMTATLKHRGPDDSGYKFLQLNHCQLGFGHRRLSIQDLSSLGHQPMAFENLTIIYNGEVYNFKAIKKELQGFGYTFKSDSDTEVILKAFHKWGVKCVEKFRGMFVFSIHDAGQNKLYIFRDRTGVKPLFYYQKEGLFLYASELKAFYSHPKFNKSINTDALSMFLQFGYIQAPYSIFKDTCKLLPAHYLEIDLMQQSVNTIKYWDLVDSYKQTKNKSSYKQSQTDLENILLESFQLRMVSDVPVGTFLSGGIDSSLVTAMLQKNSKKAINTFTIGFKDEDYNEAPYAKEIANYLKTNHNEYYCSTNDAMEIIPKLPDMYDEPFADSSAIPTALVSQVAKKKVSVVLSGDGGDELFAGYSSYLLFKKRYAMISRIPFKKALKYILKFIPDPIYSLSFISSKLYPKYLKFKNSLEFDDVANMFKLSNSVFTKCEINKALADRYCYQADSNHSNMTAVENMMLSDYKGYLADDILVKIDRAAMHISLEGREPLLDHKILEYAAKLPIEFKHNKKILKSILAKYIPRKLFERKKTGFGIPINKWLRNDLKFLIERYMNESLIKKQDIFNVIYIEQLKRLFFATKIDDRKIWTLLMFQMWYEKNIGNTNNTNGDEDF